MVIIYVRKSNLSTTRYLEYRDITFGLYKYIHGVKYRLLKSVIGTKALSTMSIHKDRTDVDD